jgi:hypothetical protein
VRFLWTDRNQDPDWPKIQRAGGMSAIFFPVTDPLADLKRRLDDVRGRGLAAGVYMAHNAEWPEFWGRNGFTIAETMHSLCAPLGKVKVQFDIEDHDPVLVETCLTRWRALEPKTDTSWTMESYQTGWMSKEFVAKIGELRVRVVPQCYSNSPTPMTPLAPDQVLRAMTRAGFVEAAVSCFYDAKVLPYNAGWDGFIFIQDRLP